MKTAELWTEILEACKKQEAIGFGLLDYFLSGSDLEKRVVLVEHECPKNAWLRLELRDTLSLNQENDWTFEVRQRLEQAASD